MATKGVVPRSGHFSPGIVIAPAAGQTTKKAKVVATTRSVWGAAPLPTPKEAAAAPDSSKGPASARAKSKPRQLARAGNAGAADQPTATRTDAAGAARTAGAPEAANETVATQVPAGGPAGEPEDA